MEETFTIKEEMLIVNEQELAEYIGDRDYTADLLDSKGILSMTMLGGKKIKIFLNKITKENCKVRINFKDGTHITIDK